MSREVTEPQSRTLEKKPLSVAEGEQSEADLRAQHAIDEQRRLIRKLIDDDKDIMALSEDKRNMVRDALALTKLSLTARHRMAKALREDKKFRAVMGKVSWYHLASYEPYADAELATGMLTGKKDYLRMYYQRLGMFPVGGKMLGAPEDDLQNTSKEEIDKRIEELLEKRESKKAAGKK